MFDEFKIIECTPLNDYKLDIKFADGRRGIIDMSYLVGKGVFSLWDDYDEFKKVTIDPITKTICWCGGIDLDPINIRNKLTAIDNS